MNSKKGWHHESYRHALAARHIKTSRYKKVPKVKYEDGEAIVRKRGKVFRVTLKSESPSSAELKRLAKLPLSDIKKRYKKSIEEEEYYSSKYPHLFIRPEEGIPEIPSHGKTMAEYQLQLEQQIQAAKRGTKITVPEPRQITEKLYDHPPKTSELTQDDFKFPEERTADELELARLQSQYDALHAANLAKAGLNGNS